MYSTFNKFGANITTVVVSGRAAVIPGTNKLWIPLGSELYNGTNATVNYKVTDYKNNCIYVGGSFTTVYDSTNVNGLTANRIAKWDISNNVWRQLGNTTYNGTNSTVYAIALDSSNNQLYVGGLFSSVQDISNTTALSAKTVARWDISNNVWRQLGIGTYNGTNSTVTSLVLDSSNNKLYVGGGFTTVQDETNKAPLLVNRIAIWDISNNVWKQFSIANYNGVNSTVTTLLLDSSNNQLYVGGSFTTAQDTTNTAIISVNRIARWDISNNVWKQFGNANYNGTNGTVYALELDYLNNQLYVGGQFTSVVDISNTYGLLSNNVSIWDISNNVWRQFGNTTYNGTNSIVNALLLDSLTNRLYVGGAFNSAFDVSCNVGYMTKYIFTYNYDSNLMSNIGRGYTNGAISATVTDYKNNCIYVGGSFTTVYDSSNVNGLSANRIAKWDISNNVWIQFGNSTSNGTNNTVNVLVLDSSNNQLYVGGAFTTVQDTKNGIGISANRIARWDISNNVWRQFGNTTYNGTNSTVNALVLDSSNNQLYVGGNFSTVQDISNTTALTTNYVARWDILNNVWRQFGNTTYNGTDNIVYALALDSLNNRLYVGGQFNNVYDSSYTRPGLNSRYITSYDYKNNVMNANIGGFTNSSVVAVIFDYKNNCIYAGGNFTIVYDSSNVNGLTANRIAKWDISNNVWRQFGNTTYNGTNGGIVDMVLDSSNNQLYVGGGFTTVQDISNTTALSAKYIARWDMSYNVWRQLGNTTYNGMDSVVNGLALDSSYNKLYAVGAFTNVYDSTMAPILVSQYIGSYNYKTDVLNGTIGGYTNGAVNATVTDYKNNCIYVGGTFTTVTDSSNTTALSAKYIAKWDISNNVWIQFGNTTYNGTNNAVNSLVLDSSNNQLYVGGQFTTVQDISNTTALSANRIARWDISNNVWRQLGNTTYNGTNSTVNALVLDSSNNQLYVGGGFTTVQDISNTTALTTNYLARWEISNNVWRQMGTVKYNGTDNTVYALELDSLNNRLYVGGSFNNVYDSSSNVPVVYSRYITSYDYKTNTINHSIGGYTNASVSTTVFDYKNNCVYVGGSFTTVYDSSNINGLTANRIAKWDISNNVWRQFGNTTYNGANGQVSAIAVDYSNNQLYVGGQFTTVQDISNTTALSAKYIARWDMSYNVWRQLGNTTYNGMDSVVTAITLDSSYKKLYVVGGFTNVYDTTTPTYAPSPQYICSYNYKTDALNGTIGQSTNGTVNATVTDYSNNCIYVGGNFTIVYDSSNVNGLSAKNIAKWDISNNVWRQFGNSSYNGLDAQISAMALDSSNNQLYVGGGFSSVQDISNTTALSAKTVARWDISNNVWRQLGIGTYNGTSAYVYTLVVDSSNNQLYVGGLFTTVTDSSNVNGLSAKYIASWDISNNVWRQFGNTTYNGTDGTVIALTLDSSNNQLYVGGIFTTVQDISNTTALSAKYVARWDIKNNVWKQFGNTTYNGTNNFVRALALDSSNTQLYVGGSFTTVQDISNTTALSAKYIARWDISNNVWRQFGNTTYNGTNAAVYALSLDSSNNQLYVGGSFTTVQDISNTTALSAKYIARWDISNNVWKLVGNSLYGNGVGNTVNALAINSSNGQLYIGGSFTSVNAYLKSSARFIAAWDISNNYWIRQNVASGAALNSVVFNKSNNQLYVGGGFTSVSDASNTTALPSKYIASLDVSNNVWNLLGNTTYNGTDLATSAIAIDTSNNQLYTVGTFTYVLDSANISQLYTRCVARWDISNNVWRQVGGIPSSSGVGNNTYACCIDISNSILYVGGAFTTVKNVVDASTTIVNTPANYVAAYDISNNVWKPLGNNIYNGVNAAVNARGMTVNTLNGQVYIGGTFTASYAYQSSSSKCLAAWDISNSLWIRQNYYNGTDWGQVNALALDSSKKQLYVGGTFTTVYDSSNVNGLSANRIAKWDISNNVWIIFGNSTANGTSSTVSALLLDSSNNQLYVGGAFTSVQDVSNATALSANRIAIWDISNNAWRQIGSSVYNGVSGQVNNGVNGQVNTLSLYSSNNQLYVGGSFAGINISETMKSGVCAWDISKNLWSNVGGKSENGIIGTVYALSTMYSSKYIYVGGVFTNGYDSINNTTLINYITNFSK